MNDIPRLLKQFGLRPKKSLGQNFLVDEQALAQIVQAAEVNANDTVLEIGPGLGSLTHHLADAARRVIAVEIDRNLIPPLQSTLANRTNVEIIQGDILQLDPAKLVASRGQLGTGQLVTGQLVISNQPTNQPINQLTNQPVNQLTNPHYKVVANIPYYITSAIIRHLIEAPIRPELLVLTVQLEVAQRIVAQPDDMNLLAVGVQFYGTPRIVGRIKADAFYPSPNVDSAMVRIDLPDTPRVQVNNVDTFFAVAKAGFSQKRKQIHNSLVAGLALRREEVARLLQAAEIDPKRRAETLTLEE
ncbi:MAG TPA: rRNA adenine N-6-methyltransferase family protein, partial [Anaerolineae bacterium]